MKILFIAVCFALSSAGSLPSAFKYYTVPRTETESFTTTTPYRNVDSLEKNGTVPFEDVEITQICNETAVAASRKRRSPSASQRNETSAQTLPPELAHLSKEFIHCAHFTFPPECYTKLANESVYVIPYDRVFDKSNYLITESILFVCPIFMRKYGEELKFPNSIHIMATVCVTISTTCIVLHMGMFAFIKRLQNLPGCCLLSLCGALMIGYLSSYAIRMELSDCKIVGMFLYYGFLASFFWMNVMSYDVWKAIKMAVNKLRLSSLRAFSKTFLLYSVYGWVSPLVIFLLAFIVSQTTTETKLKFVFSPEFCWFQYKHGLALYFVAPICGLLIVNICLFASSYYMFRKATQIQEDSDIMPRFFLYLRLASAMGLMWLLGIIAVVAQVQWLWYFHSACNALQGLFIFFSFNINSKTWRDCKNAIQKKKSSQISLHQKKTSYGNLDQ